MAHQDYISRSQNKSSSPYKNKPEEPKSSISLKVKLIFIFTLCIVIAFGYGLWVIKDAEPQPEKPATQQTKSKSLTSLPVPPKEKWTYLEKLENKEVEEGQYEVKDRGPYKMQCGSFKTEKQAEVLKANIAFSGLESQISKAKGQTSTYYKVFLGPYARKRQAEKDKHKLKNNNINGCQIWLWK